MQTETRSPKFCALCKLPIAEEDRPSVELENGEEAHIECFANRQQPEPKPN